MNITPNSLKAWFLAARPKTLMGAVAPVFVGGALGWATMKGLTHVSFCWTWALPILFCLLFALVMQIDANFINDYFDFKKGADSAERLGPKRACSQGWITPKAMKIGIFITTTIGVLCGLPLVWWGGWWMVLIGGICVLGAFVYTTKFSYIGLGDMLVILYFGIIPVFFTWFVSAKRFFTLAQEKSFVFLLFVSLVVVSGFSVGFVVDNLLVINNYRDRDLDKKNGKNTLVVRIGAKAAEWLYLINGCMAVAGALIAGKWLQRALINTLDTSVSLAHTKFPFYLIIPLIFLSFLFSTHRKMVKIKCGKQLNAILGETSVNILIFSVLFLISIIVTTLGVCYNG